MSFFFKKKKPLFNLDERTALCSAALKHLPNVEFIGYSNLLVDFARAHNSRFVLRGVRAIADFEYELQLANMNRAMLPDLDTIFLTPKEHCAFISSTLVREIASMKGQIEQFVPAVVAQALRAKFA